VRSMLAITLSDELWRDRLTSERRLIRRLMPVPGLPVRHLGNHPDHSSAPNVLEPQGMNRPIDRLDQIANLSLANWEK